MRAKRSADVARELLGDVHGILVADRSKGYLYWPADAYPFCWAHLGRDFVAMAERGGDSPRVGEALLKHVERRFAWWHRVKGGTRRRFFFRIWMTRVRARVETLRTEGATLPPRKTGCLCRSLLERKQALWTFVETEGIEPTNHAGERAVRHGVLGRRISFGTQSERVSRLVERLRTTLMTCRPPGRNVLDVLVAARQAMVNGTSPPSRVPRPRSPSGRERLRRRFGSEKALRLVISAHTRIGREVFVCTIALSESSE